MARPARTRASAPSASSARAQQRPKPRGPLPARGATAHTSPHLQVHRALRLVHARAAKLAPHHGRHQAQLRGGNGAGAAARPAAQRHVLRGAAWAGVTGLSVGAAVLGAVRGAQQLGVRTPPSPSTTTTRAPPHLRAACHAASAAAMRPSTSPASRSSTATTASATMSGPLPPSHSTTTWLPWLPLRAAQPQRAAQQAGLSAAHGAGCLGAPCPLPTRSKAHARRPMHAVPRHASGAARQPRSPRPPARPLPAHLGHCGTYATVTTSPTRTAVTSLSRCPCPNCCCCCCCCPEGPASASAPASPACARCGGSGWSLSPATGSSPLPSTPSNMTSSARRSAEKGRSVAMA